MAFIAENRPAFHRLHARLHDRILQLTDETGELIDRAIELFQYLRALAAADQIGAQAYQAVLGEPDLAREIEDLIEAAHIDAQRRFLRFTGLGRSDRRYIAIG